MTPSKLINCSQFDAIVLESHRFTSHEREKFRSQYSDDPGPRDEDFINKRRVDGYLHSRDPFNFVVYSGDVYVIYPRVWALTLSDEDNAIILGLLLQTRALRAAKRRERSKRMWIRPLLQMRIHNPRSTSAIYLYDTCILLNTNSESTIDYTIQ